MDDGNIAYSLGQDQIDGIEDILKKNLVDLGVHCVVLVDMAGNIIAEIDDGTVKHDTYSLAALAAGNFGAVNQMAEIIGEDEFSLLFHKGKKESIHLSKVSDNFLLVTIFGMEVSLGFLRLKVTESVVSIEEILEPK